MFNNPKTRSVSALIISVVSGIIIAIGMLFIFSIVLTKKDIDFRILKYFWFAIASVSSFISGFIAAKKTKIKGIIAGALSSLSIIILIIIFLIIFNGIAAFPFCFYLIPAALLSGISGGIIASNMR